MSFVQKIALQPKGKAGGGEVKHPFRRSRARRAAGIVEIGRNKCHILSLSRKYPDQEPDRMIGRDI